MPDGIEVKIDTQGFNLEMRQFAGRIQKRIARRALSEGAKVLRDIAKRLAPVLTRITKHRTPGALRNNIIRLGRRGTRASVEYSVMVRTQSSVKGARQRAIAKATGDPFYWYFLEHGWGPTGPHGQTGRNARRVVRQRARARRIVKYPFLQPAFNLGKDIALAKILSTMDTEIAKENARVV